MSNFLQDEEWVAIDTETSGLNPWQHEVIEIGAVLFNFHEVLDRFSILITPTRKQDPRSRKIHNISNEELEEKGTTPQLALEGLLKFIGSRPLIFHNAPFDVSFLTRMAQECEIQLSANSYYDSLFLSRKYFPERKSHSLQSLRDLLQIDTGVAHRALADAEATAGVFVHILNKFETSLTSRKKWLDFAKLNYKLNKFRIKLPKNLDKIQRYFDELIRSQRLIKVDYKNREGRQIKTTVVVQEVMIFNQKLFLKAKFMSKDEAELIPVFMATFHDQELGLVQFK